jgi:hypothetical protein
VKPAGSAAGSPFSRGSTVRHLADGHATTLGIDQQHVRQRRRLERQIEHAEQVAAGALARLAMLQTELGVPRR